MSVPPGPTTFSDDLELALSLADSADALTMDRFGAVDLKVDDKPDLTPVSDADLACETLIRERLSARRPADTVLGEEFGGDAVLPMLDVDWVFANPLGQLGLSGSIGIMGKSAKAFASGSTPGDPDRPRAESDETSFRLVPMSLGLIYRFTWLDDIYGVPLVRRRPYFALDRGKLRYLNAIEKANCTFCTYANGVLSHVREVAARTEQYWCPIKHARPIASPHERYHQFFDYGDAASYHQRLASQRERLRPAAVPAAIVSAQVILTQKGMSAAGATRRKPSQSGRLVPNTDSRSRNRE